MRTYNQTSTEIEQQIVKLYQEGKSSVILSKQFNTNPTTILQIVKRNGGKTRTTKETSKRYIFNENYFEKIDTEDKAYWLGFILADGCICRNDLIIALKEDDKSHIEKFIKNIDGNNKYQIVKTKGFCGCFTAARLSIRSKKIFLDLQNLGLTPNKSLTVSVPENIPNNLLRHFWRGVIDGDGYIGISRTKGKYVYDFISIGLTGSKNVINGFINFIKNTLDIELKLEKEKNVWRTKTAWNKALKIISLLYNNSTIYLNRKMEKYKKYVESKNINNSGYTQSMGSI